MKVKLFSIFVIAAVLLAAIGPGSALAGAYETDFVTSITYQNIGNATTQTISVLFYDTPSQTIPVTYGAPALNQSLAAGASRSLTIGSVISTAFQGTAVLASDQPMAATLVQVPASGPVKVRPLSTGFAGGGAQTLIPTVRKNDGGEHTVFVVQNAGLCTANASIKFYSAVGSTLVHTIPQTLAPNAGVHIDTSTISQLGATFTGSVAVTGDCTPSGTPAFVSSAMELAFGAGKAAKAFEGGSQGAGIVYMPSALCKYRSPLTAPETTSFYAVQNTSTTTATNITVTYSNGTSQMKPNIGPGAKASFGGCDAAGQTINWIGSATITSSGGVPIIAVGKIVNLPQGGLSTAFLGLSSGAPKIALPYVRWGNAAHYNTGYMQRTFIAIQNIGPNLGANTISVQFMGPDGVQQGSTVNIPIALPTGAKYSVSPDVAGLIEFGCSAGCTQFGGGAVITGPAGSQLAVVARVTTRDGVLDVGEDYTGIPYP